MCGGPEQRYNHMHTALRHPYKDAWRMQSQIHQPHSRPGAESFLTSHSHAIIILLCNMRCIGFWGLLVCWWCEVRLKTGNVSKLGSSHGDDVIGSLLCHEHNVWKLYLRHLQAPCGDLQSGEALDGVCPHVTARLFRSCHSPRPCLLCFHLLRKHS